MAVHRDDSERFRRLSILGRIGWWEADFSSRQYLCSEYVCKLLGLEGEYLSFEDFGKMIREDYRTRISREFLAIQNMEVYEQTFPIYSTEGVVWVYSRVGYKEYLPDGTLVWLNAGSKITYSQGFGMDNRQLSLEGEGYFEVVHNQDLPFEIHTHEVDLRVLGTKFNFKNYSDDEEVTVSLLEGKVALHNSLKSMSDLYLSPNEKMVLNKRTGEMVKSRARAENSMLWTNDELFFDEELLEDIAKKLMRSYDVRIEIADSLKNRRFYGSFKVMGNTIEEVLETIASTNRMKYRYENEKYILY